MARCPVTHGEPYRVRTCDPLIKSQGIVTLNSYNNQGFEYFALTNQHAFVPVLPCNEQARDKPLNISMGGA